MVNIKKITDGLHVLADANDQRASFYEEAADAVGNTNLPLYDLFQQFSEESNFWAEETEEKIRLLGSPDGHKATNNNTHPAAQSNGQTGIDIPALLSSCDHMEDKVQEAYQSVLENRKDFDKDTIGMIEMQQTLLKDCHNQVKNFRDDLAA